MHELLTVPVWNLQCSSVGCSERSMAKWSASWTHNPAVLGSRFTVIIPWIYFSVAPRFKSSAPLVNSQLVCLRPVGILNNIMLNLKYYLQLDLNDSRQVKILKKTTTLLNLQNMFRQKLFSSSVDRLKYFQLLARPHEHLCYKHYQG